MNRLLSKSVFLSKLVFFLKFAFFGIRLFVKKRCSKFKFTTCTGWKVRIYHISLRYTQKHDLFYQFQLGKKNNNKTTMFFGFSIQKVLNSRRKKCINKKKSYHDNFFCIQIQESSKVPHKHKKIYPSLLRNRSKQLTIFAIPTYTLYIIYT